MPVERARSDAGDSRVPDGAVEDTDLDGCAIPRGELRDRREFRNQRRRSEGAEGQTGRQPPNPARPHRLMHRVPVASAEALFWCSERLRGPQAAQAVSDYPNEAPRDKPIGTPAAGLSRAVDTLGVRT